MKNTGIDIELPELLLKKKIRKQNKIKNPKIPRGVYKTRRGNVENISSEEGLMVLRKGRDKMEIHQRVSGAWTSHYGNDPGTLLLTD